ncbi:single-stranded-DNA-specific exonuclease RecJ [PVC group bacterium (ex Bugula neritina AB1)]|nr:single-stranded-DNA-specific exonuclease RecJ [PVC group bacterium (ex Bugula neritina AB1)]
MIRPFKTQWDIPEYSSEEKIQIKKLSEELGISPTVGALLWARGCKTEELMSSFLNPDVSSCHDPFLLPDMSAAVDRILQALKHQEGILIHGDYDVDGISSAALLYWGFLAMGFKRVDFFLPNRMSDGYGVSEAALKKAKLNDMTLLVTSDCGVTAFEVVEKANVSNIDVIITDHHEPKDSLPEALAVINPKRKDSLYPCKDLAGVGVAFKLLQALGVSDELWDLVTLGTVADVVPLLGENRILVSKGLNELSVTKKIGLKSLLSVCGLSGKPLNVGHIGFQIAPRINARGRLGDPSDVLKMFVSKDENFAYDIAQKLNDDNQERKAIEKNILEEAHQMIKENIDGNYQGKVLVLYKPHWHEGVIGIVASRLLEAYYKPVIMMAGSEGNIAKASCRSIPSFNILDALNDSKTFLHKYGGHACAAGFSMSPENVDSLRDHINTYADKSIQDNQMFRKIRVDMDVDFDNLSLNLYSEIQKLAPFGAANETPVFLSKNVRLLMRPRLLKEKHLRLQIGGEKGSKLTVMAFGKGDFFEEFDQVFLKKRSINILYQMNLNEWQGQISLQLFLKDWQYSNED